MSDEVVVAAVHIGWGEFIDCHILSPLLVHCGIVVLCALVLHPLYAKYSNCARCSQFIDAFFGNADEPDPTYPAILSLFRLAEMCFSPIVCYQWQHRIYAMRVSEESEFVDFFMDMFFLLHFTLRCFTHGFAPQFVTESVGAYVDLYTVVPQYVRLRTGLFEQYNATASSERWITLRYFRIYQVARSYQHLSDTVELSDVSELTKFAFAFFFKTFALTLCMSGTVLILEILGPIPSFRDKYTTAVGLGDISACQMVYWITTTISTVGYGDFSPKSTVARLTMVAFILAGMIYFTIETANLVELRNALMQGKGQYVRKHGRETHIVVVGNGVCKHSSFLTSFLSELALGASGTDGVRIVFLSELTYDEELITFARRSRTVHLKFFAGNAMLPSDLDRIALKKCAIAFVIPDVSTDDPEKEDRENIMRAISMKQHTPPIRLRLMLCDHRSKLLALSMGIPTMHCISIGQLKAEGFGLSVRVRGFMTLLSGLMTTPLESDIKRMLATMADDEKDWLPQYLGGLRQCLRGFVIAPGLVGKSFCQAAQFIYNASHGKVLIVAVQHQGRLVLNYGGVLVADQVLMGITPHRDHLASFEERGKNWIGNFVSARRDAYSRSDDQSACETKTIDTTATCKYKELSTTVGDYRLKGEETEKPMHIPSLRSIASKASWQVTSNISSDGIVGDDVEYDALMSEITSEDVLNDISSRVNTNLVVGLVQGDTWHLVKHFLITLRFKFLPSWQPVLIVSPTDPPKEIVQKFHKLMVTFMVGPFDNVPNLEAIAIDKAHTLVVFNERRQNRTWRGIDTVLSDHSCVILANIIEKILWRNSSKCYTLYEFRTTFAVHLIDRNMVAEVGMPKFLGVTTQVSLTDASTLNPSTSSGGSRTGYAISLTNLNYISRFILAPILWLFKAVRKIGMQLCLGLERTSPVNQNLLNLSYHHRFAAGQVFTYDIFGTMLARVFRFPAIIEFAEALTLPTTRKQSSFVWQVRCPKDFIGRTFGELVRFWIENEDVRYSACGAILALALHRTQGLGSGRSMSYTVCLPEAETVLSELDLVTVLARVEFGTLMFGMGLLCGSEPPVAEEEVKGDGIPKVPEDSLLTQSTV